MKATRDRCLRQCDRRAGRPVLMMRLSPTGRHELKCKDDGIFFSAHGQLPRSDPGNWQACPVQLNGHSSGSITPAMMTSEARGSGTLVPFSGFGEEEGQIRKNHPYEALINMTREKKNNTGRDAVCERLDLFNHGQQFCTRVVGAFSCIETEFYPR